MDRLTFNGADGKPKVTSKEVVILGDWEAYYAAIARLAAYEDTGLTPEEGSALKADIARVRSERDAAIDWADLLRERFPLTASARELRDGYDLWRDNNGGAHDER